MIYGIYVSNVSNSRTLTK